MDPKKEIGFIIAFLVIIISVLIFISLYLSYGIKSLIYIGIISVLFSAISYLMHAFIKNKKIVNYFILSYYSFGMILLFLYTTIISFNINSIIILLIFLLFSFLLIYWRYLITAT
ncbi:MAG: hypothetical protein QW401_05860 [Thermoplasmata archaeon]